MAAPSLVNASAAPQLAQLRSAASSSNLKGSSSAVAALSAFLAQSQGKYKGPLASLRGEQVCTEVFWREFAFYLTFLHKSSGMYARLDASTIRGYLQMAFAAAEQLFGGRGICAEHRAFFHEARGSGWLGELGAEAQRQQRAQVRLAGGGRVSEREGGRGGGGVHHCGLSLSLTHS
jgi:hypothetical protein